MRLIFPIVLAAALSAAMPSPAAAQAARTTRDCERLTEPDARRDCERDLRDREREKERAAREKERAKERAAREKERAERQREASRSRGDYNFNFDFDFDEQENRDRQGRAFPSQVDTTIAFAPNGLAELNLGSGEIIVSAWNEPRVRVRASSERGGVRVDVTGGQLSVGLRSSSGAARARGRIEVTVPVGTRISTSTQSGEITVRGTRGRVKVNTMSGDVIVEDAAELVELNSLSGDVRLSRITGDVEAHTVSGDIDLSDARGDLEIQTVSGDLNLAAVAAKRVRATTTSGEILYDGSIDTDGRYTFSSTSGDLEVNVPPGAGANISLKTYSGDVDSAFPITLQPGEHAVGSANGKRFTFDIGRGGASLELETFSGSITLTNRGAGTARTPRE